MTMRVSDFVYLNTPEQVREHVDEALAILAERDLEPAQHGNMFAQILALLAAKQVQVDVVQGQGVMLGRNQRAH